MELNQNLLGEQMQMKGGMRRCENVATSQGNGFNWDPSLTEKEITDKVEKILQDEMQSGNQDAIFQLGQFYFEQNHYDKALHYFEMLLNRGDWQALFQMGVMLYDGLGIQQDTEKGFECMIKIATSTAPEAKHLIRAAQYNVGRAYFQGYGVKRSEDEAEKYWLLAADDGNPSASVKAQSTLGLFYSCSDHLDLKKAFYWHTEATGNGSLESQGALGVMYMNGLGTTKDPESAFICFREAMQRGNVYAAGQLLAYYYQRKLYTKAVELAVRLSELDDIELISQETDCLPMYINKGIAIASFYYARCLTHGRGVMKDENDAKQYYSLSFKYDPDTCARLQAAAQQGSI